MASPTPDAPDSITKEIRFAVVMYGGISLAIYMNGIAQELLSMVTATSGKSPDEQKGTARIYSAIARRLNDTINQTKCDPASEEKKIFRHKFIVDIISGTSAGGINGVCLAKGLVCGLDNLKALKNTWLNEGDIDKLLNDNQSELDIFCSKEPKTSLFNSQRMYAKLLQAFKDMSDESAAAQPAPPHVETLDLFVTATDLQGIQTPIILCDGQARERIHKHVFPFSFRSTGTSTGKTPEPNHFDSTHDPILAFASRCTSSFPAAFEPVTLNDTLAYLKKRHRQEYATFCLHLENEWKEDFFNCYQGYTDGVPLEEREFADGGYLDNRPFGHAIKAIHNRYADCPLERKLLFIDPLPETDNRLRGRTEKKEISFVQNATLAAFSLPSYETIRQEINDLTERNAWVRTVDSVLQKVDAQNTQRLKSIIEEDFDTYSAKNKENAEDLQLKTKLFSSYAVMPHGTQASETNPIADFWHYIARQKSSSKPTRQEQKEIDGTRYEEMDLLAMIKKLGDGYTPYHYTKVTALTEQLVEMLVRACGFDHRQDLCQRMRTLVENWRTEHFKSLQSECASDKDQQTENIFFRNYDLDFRIRRLDFFRKKIETAIGADNVSALYFGLYDAEDNAPCDEELRTRLIGFYATLVEGLRSLYRMKEHLMSRGRRNPFAQEIDRLLPLLKEDAAQAASDADASFPERFHALMKRLNDLIKDGFEGCTGSIDVSTMIDDAFITLGTPYPAIAARMKYIYRFGYDLYDSTTFQLMAGGDYGEGTQIEIYRISPADATSLWDESTRKNRKGETLSKLAGTSLGAFGGFLDREWRHNDIMWGRLDAAERIINVLLPQDRDNSDSDRDFRRDMIDDAHRIIIRETLEEWSNELDSTRFTSNRDGSQYGRLKEILKDIDTEGWQEKFKTKYDFNRDLEPEPNLQRLGRSSGILSSMIDRLDTGEGMTGKISGYLKKLNWILLGLLDFSTPKTFKSVILGYWMHLLVLVSAVIITGGYLIDIIDTQSTAAASFKVLGFALLGVTIVILLFRQHLETHIHQISCRKSTRLALQILQWGALALLCIALFILASTLYQVGGELWELLRNSYTHNLQAIADAILRFMSGLLQRS